MTWWFTWLPPPTGRKRRIRSPTMPPGLRHRRRPGSWMSAPSPRGRVTHIWSSSAITGPSRRRLHPPLRLSMDVWVSRPRWSGSGSFWPGCRTWLRLSSTILLPLKLCRHICPIPGTRNAVSASGAMASTFPSSIQKKPTCLKRQTVSRGSPSSLPGNMPHTSPRRLPLLSGKPGAASPIRINTWRWTYTPASPGS